MENDLIEAKNYLDEQGYGSGTNYTTNLVAVLLANYAEQKVKKLNLPDVVLRSELLPKRLSNEAYQMANMVNYDEFVEWWDSQV